MNLLQTFNVTCLSLLRSGIELDGRRIVICSLVAGKDVTGDGRVREQRCKEQCGVSRRPGQSEERPLGVGTTCPTNLLTKWTKVLGHSFWLFKHRFHSKSRSNGILEHRDKDM